MLAVVTEPFTHGAAGEGRKVLERSSLRGGGSDNDRVLHRIVFLKGLDELSDGRTLLANSDVDTVKLLVLLVTLVPALLVEDSVDGDGGLAGLTATGACENERRGERSQLLEEGFCCCSSVS